jgi:hypothetical protein
MDDTTELRGTFACPICGQESPHHHSDEQVAAYRDDQVRRDGWTSAVVRLPRDRVGGFYLIRGHHIKVPKDDYSNVSYNVYQRVTEGPGYPAEVAQWDESHQSFALLHWAGNARLDGSEGRSPVFVTPTHWRDLPAFGVPSDSDAANARVSGLQAMLKDIRTRYHALQYNEEHARQELMRQIGELQSGASPQ